jgi:hypothetical protein
MAQRRKPGRKMKMRVVMAAVAAMLVVSAAEAEEPKAYRVVDAADVFLAPNKFLGKDIEIRGVYCYFADVDDYRCITSGDGPVIFTKAIEADEGRKLVEENCDTIKKATGAKCRVTVRLNYDGVDRDELSDRKTRVILRPASVTVIATAAESRPGKRR